MEIWNLLTISNFLRNLGLSESEYSEIKDIIDGIEIKEKEIDINQSENLLGDQNYSFEKGLWSKTIDTCEKNNTEESILSQSLHYKCTDGNKCINITSKNNTGCVSSFFTLDLKKGFSYNLYFDYKQTIKDSRASILFI